MYLEKKTKIIATIGPASESETSIKRLLKDGVNIFRFNMKHGTIDWHQKTMQKVQKIADSINIPVGILIDLQGPEIRIQTRDKQDIPLKKGAEIKFSKEFKSSSDVIWVPHESVFKALGKGDHFVIDDGFLQFKVIKKVRGGFIAKIHDDGVIKHMKTLNLVGIDIELPSLIKDDIDRLSLATSERVDYVALSFTRSKSDLDLLRKEMRKHKINAQVVAKIESQAALDNIDEIIEHSDVIMIARGDLGVETPLERLAYYQKMMINKCRAANTPVIVATQMLQSMILNPIPTRAEATDVANAVLDGTDALMLSGETATGKYPIKSVSEMSKIAIFNEKNAAVMKFDVSPTSATELIVEAAEVIAEHAQRINLDHIIVFTQTGYTARALASFRPKIPILAVTNMQKTVETLTISYGVHPVRLDFPSGKILQIEKLTSELKQVKKIKKGENVLIIHGQHWNVPGQTNAIVLIKVK